MKGKKRVTKPKSTQTGPKLKSRCQSNADLEKYPPRKRQRGSKFNIFVCKRDDEGEIITDDEEEAEYVLGFDPYNQESSERFIEVASNVLGWGDLSGNVVLDIGCGLGTTSRAMVKLFPKVKKVIGIDISTECLKNAEQANKHRRIAYEYGDITNIYTLVRWAGQVDKVISMFCFNCKDYSVDERTAFKTLFMFMKPGGEGAILLCPQEGFLNFIKEITETPKWKKYFQELKNIESTALLEDRTTEYWKDIAEDAGFVVIKCYEIDSKSWSYACDEQCKNHISKVLASRIPEEKRKEFIEETFEVFVKHNNRDSNGQLTVTHSCFAVFIKKPNPLEVYPYLLE